MLGGFTSGRLMATYVALAMVIASVASASVSSIASSRVALFTALHRTHLVLAELLELPAVADVVGVPAVEKAVWLAGVTDIILTLTGEFTFRFCGKDRRFFTLVLLCLGLGVRRRRGCLPFTDEETPFLSLGTPVGDPEEFNHSEEFIFMDPKLLMHPLISGTGSERVDDFLVRDVRDAAANLAETLNKLMEHFTLVLFDGLEVSLGRGVVVCWLRMLA